MTIESELQAQLDFLRRPDTVWVQRSPVQPGEACMIARRYRSGEQRCFQLLGESYGWLWHWFAVTYGTQPVQWNDATAPCRDEVVERLEKAVAAAGEQGV